MDFVEEFDMEKSKTKIFWTVTGLSLLLFLSTFWIGGYSLYAEAWAHSICFFALTWLCLYKFLGQAKIQGGLIVGAVILGRILLEVPVRSFFFVDCLKTTMVPIITIVSILLACVCFYEKRMSVYALSVVIIILLNVFAHEAWISGWMEHFGTIRNLK